VVLEASGTEANPDRPALKAPWTIRTGNARYEIDGGADRRITLWQRRVLSFSPEILAAGFGAKPVEDRLKEFGFLVERVVGMAGNDRMQGLHQSMGMVNDYAIGRSQALLRILGPHGTHPCINRS
jgi:hypothetical protein